MSKRGLGARTFAVCVLTVGALMGLVACSSAGRPSSTSAATPAQHMYAGGCMSASAASSAIAAEVRLQSAKLTGREYDCDYENSAGVSLRVGYIYSASTSPKDLLAALERYTPKSELTPVPGLGNSAYAQVSSAGAVLANAVAHHYSISLVSRGIPVAAADDFLRTVVHESFK